MRYDCSRCREGAERCAEFLPVLTNIEMPTETSLCLCGHHYAVHAVFPSAQLPAKGDCAESRCDIFRPISHPIMPRTICECGQIYLAHSSQNNPSTSEPVAPPASSTSFALTTPVFSAWQPPQPPDENVSTNDRRVSAMTSHRNTPIFRPRAAPAPVSVVRGPGSRQTNSASSRNVRRCRNSAESALLPTNYNFDIAILGYPLSGLYDDKNDLSFRRIWVDRHPDLVRAMNEKNLIIIESQNAQPHDIAVDILDSIIQAHLALHNLAFPPSPEPAIVATAGQTTEEANYYQLTWKFVSAGYKRNDRLERMLYQSLNIANIPYHQTTWHEIFSNAPSTIGKELWRLPKSGIRQMLFIAPSFGKIRGPIYPNSAEQHPCFPSRIFYKFVDAKFDNTSAAPKCSDGCPIPVLATTSNLLIEPAADFSPPTPEFAFLPTALLNSPQSPLFAHSPSHLSFTPPSTLSVLSDLPNLQLDIPTEVHIHGTFQSWRNFIELQVTRDEEIEASFIMNAEDVGTAAQALIEFIAAQHMGQKTISRLRQAQLRVKIPPGSTIVGLFWPSNVLIHVGAGSGDGVIRSVLDEAIRIIVRDSLYWREIVEEGYVSLAPRRESSETRRLDVQACGTLIMVAIFHGITPDPISPFLLASLLGGDNILQNQVFMASVAPITAAKLSEWPTDGSVPRGSKNLSVLSHLGYEHRDIADYNIPQLERLSKEVFTGFLVGRPDASELAALEQGLRVFISEEVPDIFATLKSSVQAVFRQLYTRRVDSPDKVLKLVKFLNMANDATLPFVHDSHEADDLPYDGLSLRALATQFMQHFARYLRGAGHPDHEVYNALIPYEVRESARTDLAFRARHFLTMISGSSFLSLEPKELEIRFVRRFAQEHIRPADAPADWKVPAQPIFFHSCFYYAELPVTHGLLALLHSPVPDDLLVVSDFDLWLHEGVFPMSAIVEGSSETFNQL